MTSLQSLMGRVAETSPVERLIFQARKRGYATRFGRTPGDLAVLRLAIEIEPCADELLTWYTSVRIHELGEFTAQRLVAMGRAEAVVDFLASVHDGSRD